MEQPPSIIQHGAQSQANVNTGNGTIVVNNNYQQINTLSEVSKYLRSWYSFVYKEKHIERAETEKLWNWITRWEDVKNPMDRVSLLVGDAGSGKSVVMHDLLLRLENEGIKTLGLKSDLLFASESDLDRAVGLGQSVSSVLSEIANAEKVNGQDDAAKAEWFPINNLPPLAFDHEDIMKDAIELLQKP